MQMSLHPTRPADVQLVDLSFIHGEGSADSSDLSCTGSYVATLQSTGSFSDDQSLLQHHGDVDISTAEVRSQDGSSCTQGSIVSADSASTADLRCPQVVADGEYSDHEKHGRTPYVARDQAIGDEYHDTLGKLRSSAVT